MMSQFLTTSLPIHILIPIIIAISGIVGFAVRTWVKSHVEHSFNAEMENLKSRYAQDLELIKARHTEDLSILQAQNTRTLEETKAELSVLVNWESVEIEAHKKTLQEAVVARCQHFPILIGCLRKIKGELQSLYNATSGENEYMLPIDLTKEHADTQLVKASLVELKALAEFFEKTLDEVRMFTTRSDFSLPILVKRCLIDWEREKSFSISKKYMTALFDAYSDDVAFLTEEFYHPGFNRLSLSGGDLFSRRFAKLTTS